MNGHQRRPDDRHHAAPPSVNEGSLYSLTLGAVTDPGTDTVTEYIVHWGDGSSDTYSHGDVKTHTYADGPHHAITVDLADEDGTFTDAGHRHERYRQQRGARRSEP